MRERYGVDAPRVFVTIGAVGLLCAVAAVLVGVLVGGALGAVLAGFLALWAVVLAVQAGWAVLGSLLGKRREWRRLLDGLGLAGDERVLEVGPGTGPVLVEVARRVPFGRVVGVDLWRPGDQAGNSRGALLGNAAAAGVSDRVEVIDGDMRALPLPDRSFDVVLASLAVHNLPAGDRPGAVREMLRVLAPGGRLVILDFQGTADYARALRAAEAVDVQLTGRHWTMHPPVRIVTARRSSLDNDSLTPS
jgi:arsenite methyltransferase